MLGSSVTATDQSLFRPGEIHSIEDTGLSHGLLLDLILKHAFFEGTVTLRRLGERTKLSPPVIHAMYRHLQKEQLCETRAMVGNDYEISLSNKGRAMVDVAMKKSQYAGEAPVPLADYNHAVTSQIADVRVNREILKATLEDLVLPDDVIREIGTALVTGGTTMLYGSTGTGKTSIAERLHRVFDDLIYIPHAVEVNGHIVTVFDPLIHRAQKEEPASPDPRWVLCRRPMVKVGGEMSAEMLDTRVDEHTRVCIAPLQMKANNGILLIDDFGRQHISPRELLNRWIVPLDRHTDVLTLWSGVSFEIPFELLVVFATNLALSSLAEDAFLRRLKNKIRIDPLREELFKQLLRRVCAENDLPCTDDMQDYVTAQCKKHSPEGLRGCFPLDLVTIIRGSAAFDEREPTLGEEDVDQAIRVYFIR
jgi:predicted ATPase with chaperone activity